MIIDKDNVMSYVMKDTLTIWAEFEDRVDRNIKEIRFIPPFIKKIDVSGSNINKMCDIPEGVVSLYIDSTKIHKLPKLPDSLEDLIIDESPITKIEELPKNLKYLSAAKSKLEYLETIPNNLSYLDLTDTLISELPKNITKKLKYLFTYGCKNLPKSDWVIVDPGANTGKILKFIHVTPKKDVSFYSKVDEFLIKRKLKKIINLL